MVSYQSSINSRDAIHSGNGFKWDGWLALAIANKTQNVSCQGHWFYFISWSIIKYLFLLLLVYKLFSHEICHLVSYVRRIVDNGSGSKQSGICHRKIVVTSVVACTLFWLWNLRRKKKVCVGVWSLINFFLVFCILNTTSMRKVGLDFSSSLILLTYNKPLPSMVAGSVRGGQQSAFYSDMHRSRITLPYEIMINFNFYSSSQWSLNWNLRDWDTKKDKNHVKNNKEKAKTTSSTFQFFFSSENSLSKGNSLRFINKNTDVSSKSVIKQIVFLLNRCHICFVLVKEEKKLLRCCEQVENSKHNHKLPL